MTDKEKKEYNRRYYLENAEKIRARSSAWNAENKEYVNERNKEYRARNIECIREYDRNRVRTPVTDTQREKQHARSREYEEKKRNRDRVLARGYQRNQRMRPFGKHGDHYEEMLAKQNNACAICNRPESRRRSDGEVWDFAVDHDHTTNSLRGLLCSNCNRGIGLLKDSKSIIKSAARYLEIHSNTKWWHHLMSKHGAYANNANV